MVALKNLLYNPTYRYQCLYLHLYLSLYLHLFLYLDLYLSIPYLYLYIYLHRSMSISISVSLSVSILVSKQFFKSQSLARCRSSRAIRSFHPRGMEDARSTPASKGSLGKLMQSSYDMGIHIDTFVHMYTCTFVASFICLVSFSVVWTHSHQRQNTYVHDMYNTRRSQNKQP